jgi:hypothetical protein
VKPDPEQRHVFVGRAKHRALVRKEREEMHQDFERADSRP